MHKLLVLLLNLPGPLSLHQVMLPALVFKLRSAWRGRRQSPVPLEMQRQLALMPSFGEMLQLPALLEMLKLLAFPPASSRQRSSPAPSEMLWLQALRPCLKPA
jgi:hypothetical protein